MTDFVFDSYYDSQLSYPGFQTNFFSRSERTVSDSKSTVEDGKKCLWSHEHRTSFPCETKLRLLPTGRNEAHHLQTFLKIAITVIAIHFNSFNNFGAISTTL